MSASMVLAQIFVKRTGSCRALYRVPKVSVGDMEVLDTHFALKYRITRKKGNEAEKTFVRESWE